MPTPYKVLSRPSEITPSPTPEGSGSIPASGSLPACTLCGAESSELRFLPLYVIGSEGIQACHDCCIALTGVAKSIKLATSKARITGYKAAKAVAARKAENNTGQGAGQ